MDLLLAISLVFLLLLFLGICFSRAILPVYGAWVLVVARGDAEDLQHKLYALMWLRNLGLLRCPIYILNQGLRPEGLKLVERLCLRWSHVSLCDDLFENFKPNETAI